MANSQANITDFLSSHLRYNVLMNLFEGDGDSPLSTGCFCCGGKLLAKLFFVLSVPPVST